MDKKEKPRRGFSGKKDRNSSDMVLNIKEEGSHYTYVNKRDRYCSAIMQVKLTWHAFCVHFLKDIP